MLIEQDRSKPIAHAEKLLVLIKKNKGRCFPCTLISETVSASCLKDETRKGLGVLSGLPRHRREHTHLRHKSYPTLTPDQEIKAGIPFILYIFLSYFSPPSHPFPSPGLFWPLKQLFFHVLKESKIFKKPKPNNKEKQTTNKQKTTTKAVWVLICFQKSVHLVHLKFYVCLLPTFSF